jgi:catechol 2,3-dioxygenase-like lactoylglutathione lyase family enzyme
MAQVVDIGGVFYKASDPDTLRAWYRDRLGMDLQPWGGTAFLHGRKDRPGTSYTVWSLFPADTDYLAPSDKPFMINLRVDDLDGMLAQLREGGATVLDRRQAAENGKFGYVVDPEGTLIELWEQSDDDPYMPSDD